MNLRALVFDFDGLIVDTEAAGFISWGEIFAEYGQELTLEDWRLATGYVDMFDPQALLEKRLGHSLDWTILAPRREARNWELTLQAPTLPGIESLMRGAREKGLRVAVASNSGFGWVEDGLIRLGLRRYVEAVVTRDSVVNPKPAPDIYLKAVQTLGVSPADAVAFEDSEPGSRSAKAAGLTVIVIPNQFSERQDLSQADLIVKSAVDLDLGRIEKLLEDRRS